MKHSVKQWFQVTRYWSFPVSTMPILVTFAYYCSIHQVDFNSLLLVKVLLSLLAVVILHAAGNVISDWADFRYGVDNEQSFAVPNLVYNYYTPKEYLVFGIILFLVGIILGFVLTYFSGWGLLVIGGIGVLLTVFYSFLKYHALGDLNIFMVFGLLIVMGSSYVIMGQFRLDALFLAVPIGIVTVSVLHANNTLDIESDKKAGIKTFAMLLGGKKSVSLYILYMIIPFLFVIIAVAFGGLHWLSLVSLLSFGLAIKNIKKVSQYVSQGTSALVGLDQMSAKLQLAFSGMLAISLFVASLL